MSTTDKLVKGNASTAKQYDPNAGEAGAELWARVSLTGEPLPVKGVANGDGTSSLVVAPTGVVVDLDAIETTYNNVTTTATSASVDSSLYRFATISFSLTKANTPTDILFDVELSADNTNWRKCLNGFLANWLYDDTVVGSGGLNPALTFRVASPYMRVKVTATGTTASNTFTIATAQLYLQN